jgi:hypothetical protein
MVGLLKHASGQIQAETAGAMEGEFGKPMTRSAANFQDRIELMLMNKIEESLSNTGWTISRKTLIVAWGYLIVINPFFNHPDISMSLESPPNALASSARLKPEYQYRLPTQDNSHKKARLLGSLASRCWAATSIRVVPST